MIIFSLTVALSRATSSQRRLAQYAALKEYERRMKEETVMSMPVKDGGEE